MRYLIIILIPVILIFCGCAANSQAESGAAYGYLRLSGSMVNREAYVDGSLVGVDPEDDSTTLRLKSGNHKLEIHSANRILLAEDLLITEKCTTVITVP